MKIIILGIILAIKQNIIKVIIIKDNIKVIIRTNIKIIIKAIVKANMQAIIKVMIIQEWNFIFKFMERIIQVIAKQVMLTLGNNYNNE